MKRNLTSFTCLAFYVVKSSLLLPLCQVWSTKCQVIVVNLMQNIEETACWIISRIFVDMCSIEDRINLHFFVHDGCLIGRIKLLFMDELSDDMALNIQK